MKSMSNTSRVEKQIQYILLPLFTANSAGHTFGSDGYFIYLLIFFCILHSSFRSYVTSLVRCL